MRSVEMEHVRVSGHSCAQVCIGGRFPLVMQRLAIDRLETIAAITASRDIEAGRDADDIELVDSTAFGVFRVQSSSSM